jgi:integrase
MEGFRIEGKMISETFRTAKDVRRYSQQRAEECAFTPTSAVSNRPLADANVSSGERLTIQHAKSVLTIRNYNPVIQDARMTLGFFVETKFIPEHVEHKTRSGRTHYQAMLKHLLAPELVNRLFDPSQEKKARLKSVPGWPYLDDVRLCDIRPDHVRQIISSAFDHGYSAQTVKHIRNVIFAVISHAQREGCFSGSNPVTQVKLPPAAGRVKHNLSISQTRAMLELMEYPEKEIALITITTGMNVQEICNLQWKHINLTESERYLNGELVPSKSIAVGAEWNRVGLGDWRRGRRRNIEIPDVLLPMLENLRSQKEAATWDDFVLLSETGHPVVPAGVRVGRLKPIGRKLGIPWLSWHVLRRAHTGFLVEFRSQFNQHVANLGSGPSRASAGSEPSPCEIPAPTKSDTIARKYCCRSFRTARYWREHE